MIKKTSIRVGDISFRWTKSIGANEYSYPEIVRWQRSDNEQEEYCYTLAQWEEGKECYSLSFCGKRPFNLSKLESNVFWQLAKEMQEKLDKSIGNV